MKVVSVVAALYDIIPNTANRDLFRGATATYFCSRRCLSCAIAMLCENRVLGYGLLVFLLLYVGGTLIFPYYGKAKRKSPEPIRIFNQKYALPAKNLSNFKKLCFIFFFGGG